MHRVYLVPIPGRGKVNPRGLTRRTRIAGSPDWPYNAAPQPMRRSNHAFTLLEIMMAVLIGIMIIAVAIPSLDGLIDERKARAKFDAFEALVEEGLRVSMNSGAPTQLIWEQERVVLISLNDGDELRELPIEEKERYRVEFPAALVPEPPARWTLWPTGTCEPAVIRYSGRDVKWEAIYDPLTVEAEYSHEQI